jgi:hypothetical protein
MAIHGTVYGIEIDHVSECPYTGAGGYLRRSCAVKFGVPKTSPIDRTKKVSGIMRITASL